MKTREVWAKLSRCEWNSYWFWRNSRIQCAEKISYKVGYNSDPFLMQLIHRHLIANSLYWIRLVFSYSARLFKWLVTPRTFQELGRTMVLPHKVWDTQSQLLLLKLVKLSQQSQTGLKQMNSVQSFQILWSKNSEPKNFIFPSTIFEEDKNASEVSDNNISYINIFHWFILSIASTFPTSTNASSRLYDVCGISNCTLSNNEITINSHFRSNDDS